ncbi:sensor histidine kinase [Leifsonia sp. A12D58]|uniref:sensor histidine kinase n=1 Tax=Leifsonia sp. A12D58 TaxID=3397674 RepID=UPI0039E0B4FA
MEISRKVLASCIAPALAGVFLTLWLVAEAGRGDFGGNVVLFSLLVITIALSAWLPAVSLVMMIAVPLLQIVGLVNAPTSTSWPTYLAFGFAAFFVGWRARGPVRYLAVPVGAMSSALIAVNIVLPAGQNGWLSWTGQPHFDGSISREMVTLCLAAFGLFIAAWAIGFAVAAMLRAIRVTDELESATSRMEETGFELRLAQDRARISRDVHDALAHSLAVIVSQAQGALALQAARPEVAADSLNNIAFVGRTALVEVRQLVGRIQDETEAVTAETSIVDLPALVEHMRDLGMDATLRSLGVPINLLRVHELAVYRIVQECLTNALKHAGSRSRVTVVLDWRGPGLALLITSRGERPLIAPTGSRSRGVGIDGMRERARLAGGWLTAEMSDEDSAFVVTAFIPAGEMRVIEARVETPATEGEPVDA